MLTAAVRDLKITYPDLVLGVRTTASFLWENNPHLTKNPLNAEVLYIGYETPHQNPNTPRTHFIYAFHRSLERRFDIQITRGKPFPDIWLSPDDNFEISTEKPILLINAGHKPDFPIKQWPLSYFQEVVDKCQDAYTIIQIGETTRGLHVPLKGTVNLLNKTPGRLLIGLMRQASAVLSGVSYPMHLCAGINAADGVARKCVVVAGNREDPCWERYPGFNYLTGHCDYNPESNDKGCWFRYLPSDNIKNDEYCKCPLRLPDMSYSAQCMYSIHPEQVIKCLLETPANPLQSSLVTQ